MRLRVCVSAPLHAPSSLGVGRTLGSSPLRRNLSVLKALLLGPLVDATLGKLVKLQRQPHALLVALDGQIGESLLPGLEPLGLQIECVHVVDEPILAADQLVVLQLQLGDGLLALHDPLSGVIDSRILDLVPLLKVDNKLVLPLDDVPVILDLRLVLGNFVALLLVIVVKEVIEALDLDVTVVDLVVLDLEQLPQLLDLFHRVLLARLEVLHH